MTARTTCQPVPEGAAPGIDRNVMRCDCGSWRAAQLKNKACRVRSVPATEELPQPLDRLSELDPVRGTDLLDLHPRVFG